MRSLIAAFSLYSKIPVPHTESDEESMRYVMCWFPLIGAVTGLAQWAVYCLFQYAGAGTLFRAAVLTAVPLLITGGIHLDGFMDTTDALRSYKSREEKLEILKDSHVGAFAVIGCGIWLMLTAGAWSGAGRGAVLVMCAGFVLERALSGMAAVNFRQARADGMLSSVSRPARQENVKKRITAILAVTAVLTAAWMCIVWPFGGILCTVCALLIFVYYHHMAVKEFGGTTGDLAGWFVQSCELGMLIAAAAAELIENLI